MFGAALWQTRPRSDPELDLLLAELAIGPASGRGAGAVLTMRTWGCAYIVLGALVTALRAGRGRPGGDRLGSIRATIT